MFKEIGSLIDAAGKVAAESLRVSANAVRKALSDEDDNDGRTMGILTPDPKELPKELKDVLNKSESKEVIVKLDKDGKTTEESAYIEI